MEFNPFCHAFPNRVLDQDAIMLAMRDSFSISADSLITFKHHISSFFKLTEIERQTVMTNQGRKKYQLKNTEKIPRPIMLAAEIMEQLGVALEAFRSTNDIMNGNGANSP